MLKTPIRWSPTALLHSLASRVLGSFLMVLVALAITAFVLTNVTSEGGVKKLVGEQVAAGARAFERLLDLDMQRMIEGTRVLVSDPAFAERISAKDGAVVIDQAAVSPMLAAQARRIGAPMMMLVDKDYRVAAGTLPSEIGRRVAYSKLLERAAAQQQASGIASVGGQLYELAIVPVLTPAAAWVVAGTRIDDSMAQDLRSLTGLDVSFAYRQAEGPWKMAASTLPEPDRRRLVADVAANRLSRSDDAGNAEYDGAAVSRVVNLAPRIDEGVVAVLQGPLAPMREPLRVMQREHAIVFMGGVLITLLGGIALARRVLGRLRELTLAARRGAAGDYAPIAAGTRGDEIGELATAFRAMQESVREAMSRITALAHRDALTGLPTRALFADRLEQAVAAASRAGSPVSVLVLDIDEFGHVNDTLGRAIGDLLLREVAARLRAGVRRASDSAARVGADEFALMMPGNRAADAQRVAEAVRRALEVKMTLGGHVVDVRASIGIASCPDHGTDAVRLIERAEVALQAAKRDKLGVVVWDERYEENGEKRLALMSDLKLAVDNDELALIYQPAVALGEAGDHTVEALLRWQHPTRGIVAPADFIPHAEQTGYIRAITQWVLGRAIAQCVEWRSHGLSMHVAVNLSARDLTDDELATRLKAMLEREGCSAQWLTLEIAESAIVGEPGHALKNLERLREVGCRLAVDDYGAGYSSLAYLRRLPLDELKIDRSFIMGMVADAGDALIVRSTIELAHKLGLAVVASGVEDEATLDMLRELGCERVQGFLLSRPLEAADIPGWVKESSWTRPAREKGLLRRVV